MKFPDKKVQKILRDAREKKLNPYQQRLRDRVLKEVGSK